MNQNGDAQRTARQLARLADRRARYLQELPASQRAVMEAALARLDTQDRVNGRHVPTGIEAVTVRARGWVRQARRRLSDLLVPQAWTPPPVR
jgi:hypothetical protein